MNCPALIRRARRPGVAESWVQPLGAHDAYKLLDPFTGQPDEWPAWKPWDGNNANLYQVGAKASHNGKRWVSNTPNNHWEPGVFGWVEQP